MLAEAAEVQEDRVLELLPVAPVVAVAVLMLLQEQRVQQTGVAEAEVADLILPEAMVVLALL
jgi:hypothetical protein